MGRLTPYGLAWALIGLWPGWVGAQANSCADCHFANPETEPAGRHLGDWDVSPHGRKGVGCEACHGGDATTFEAMLAHRDVLSSRNPVSPTNERNLPQTCGRCHPSHLSVFRDTKHYELVRAGDRRAPTCSSCHGAVAADLMSPRGLAAKCNTCHGPDTANHRPELAAQVRVLLEAVRDAREDLKQARRLVGRAKDPERRERLEILLEAAETPLMDVTHIGHTLDFRGIDQKIAEARAGAETLMFVLANPQ